MSSSGFGFGITPPLYSAWMDICSAPDLVSLRRQNVDGPLGFSADTSCQSGGSTIFRRAIRSRSVYLSLRRNIFIEHMCWNKISPSLLRRSSRRRTTGRAYFFLSFLGFLTSFLRELLPLAIVLPSLKMSAPIFSGLGLRTESHLHAPS